MRVGWKQVALESVAKIVNGGTPKTKVAEYWGAEHQWITPAEMGKLDNPYVSESRRQLSNAGLKHSSATLVPENSVILSTRAPIGHVVINSVPMAFNQGCRAIVPSDELVYKYLYYFLFANKPLLNDLGTGTTFKELAAGKLKKVEIPLPPLSEQKRIVTILDEAFAGVETAIANTEKNIANARELFESYMSAVFHQHGEGWTRKPLGEVCILQRGFDLPKRLRNDGHIDLVGSSGVIDHHNEAKVKGPGVATGRSGSIGGVFFIKNDFWPLNTVLYVKEFFGNNPEFICYLLKQFDLKKYTSGAGVPTLNRNHVHNEIVNIPISPSKQSEIATNLNNLSIEHQRLDCIYQQKLTALTALKQSLLQKAFSGELTAETEKEVKEAVA